MICLFKKKRIQFEVIFTFDFLLRYVILLLSVRISLLRIHNSHKEKYLPSVC